MNALILNRTYLPVAQSNNLKTAKILGSVPPGVLGIADEVIE